MTLNMVVRPTSSTTLRASTRGEHEAVEAGLDLRRLHQPAGLAAFLHAWKAVWEQVGIAATMPGACAEATAELLVPCTQALGWLDADLADLGRAHNAASVRADVTAAGLDGANHLRHLLARPSSSWGVAYVLRGSRLGGTVLAPVARAAMELPGDYGTRFLASSGTDPGREWVGFRRRLDAADLPAPGLAVAIEAARWTFRWVGAVTTAPSAQTSVLAGQAPR